MKGRFTVSDRDGQPKNVQNCSLPGYRQQNRFQSRGKTLIGRGREHSRIEGQVEEIKRRVWEKWNERQWQGLTTSTASGELVSLQIDQSSSIITQQSVMEYDTDLALEQWSRQAEEEAMGMERRIEELRERERELLRFGELLAKEMDSNERRIKRERERLEQLQLNRNNPVFVESVRLRVAAMQFEGHFEEEDIDVDGMTYEQLLELGERIGSVSKGLSEQQLRRLCSGLWRGEECRCSVCCEGLDQSSLAVSLPCQHSFHQECAFGWLRLNKSCPLCKAEVIL